MLGNAETPSEREQHIADLKWSIQNGIIVVITGTGVSLQVAKELEIVEGFQIASWPGLLHHGIKHCQNQQLIDQQRADQLRQRISWNNVEEMIQVADIIKAEMKECSSGTFQQWLYGIFSNLKIGNPQLVIAIKNLGGILATLNYDTLLEQQTKRTAVTWKQHSKVGEVIKGQKVYSTTGESVEAVLHLHGYWDDADSVVFGTTSYCEVTSDAYTQEILRTFAVAHTILFVGCGRTLDDPNFRQFIDWANKVLADMAPHYILCLNGEVEDFRQNTRNIPWLHPIGYGEKYDDLTPFIEKLAKYRVEPMPEAASTQLSIAWDNGISFTKEWHLLTIKAEPKVLIDVLLLSRKQAVEKLEDLVSGKCNELCLQTRFPREIVTFVAAFLASRDMLKSAEGRLWLLIRDRETWQKTAAITGKRLILVAHPSLDFESNHTELVQLAREHGHATIYPTLLARVDDNTAINLPQPHHYKVAEALKRHGTPPVQAEQLAHKSNGNLPLLIRHLIGIPERPPWARQDQALRLRSLALLGGWQVNTMADSHAIAAIVGHNYREWSAELRAVCCGEEPPFIQSYNTFRPVSRYQNWQMLGAFLTDEDLDRFEQTAIDILRTDDPKFELPTEERQFAMLPNKQALYSDIFRRGIAETLALLGGKSEVLNNCSPGKAREVVCSVVHAVLYKADWRRWASLGSLVSLLAEADPGVFLRTVQTALHSPVDNALKQLFKESEGGILGGFYHTGLLWALEVLAWKPEYLNRVALILTELDQFPLPHNIANRPLNTLRKIFLPWLPQTCATIEQRKSAVQAIINENSKTGWELLLQLLPEIHSSSDHTQRPIWRDWIPSEWDYGGTNQEHWEQERNYAQLAFEIAQRDLEKLRVLIHQIDRLPREIFDTILQKLESQEMAELPEDKRFSIWQTLVGKIHWHRRFSHAQWALPTEPLTELEKVAQLLEPKAPQIRFQYLFNSYDIDFFESDNYDVERQKIADARKSAVREVLTVVSLEGLMTFAQQVSQPNEVGVALGHIAGENVDTFLLPQYLEVTDENLLKMTASFIWVRFFMQGFEWVNHLSLNKWMPVQIGRFYSFLPFSREVWESAEAKLGNNASEYWRHINTWPLGSAEELLTVVEKLLQYNRGVSALMTIYSLISENHDVSPDLALQAIHCYLNSSSEDQNLDHYQVGEIIDYLQNNPSTDQVELGKLEWLLLPIFNRVNGHAPIALEKSLARRPSFFVEIIQAVYRPNGKEPNGELASEEQKKTTEKGLKLLWNWKIPPGQTEAGEFDGSVLKTWLTEAEKLCGKSGHWEVAQTHIGKVLVYAPTDPDGLWLHRAAASILNTKDHGDMRGGFYRELFNRRGIFSPSGGTEERKLAVHYQEQAKAMDNAGFINFAAALYALAERYLEDAKREEKRERFEEN